MPTQYTGYRFCRVNVLFVLLLLLAGCIADGSAPASRSLIDEQRGLQRADIPTISNSRSQLALVIGNASYQHVPLQNPLNDAQDMAAVLRERGFQVTVARDLDYATLDNIIRSFSQRLQRQRGIGLLYYAGHGVEVEGENYLIPVNNAQIKDKLDVRNRAVSVNHILDRFQTVGADLSILILDACRDDPFPNSRSLRQGLRGLQSPSGTVIAFATSPGDVASDNQSGRNGLYTRHLIRAIRQSGVPIEQTFKRVRQSVSNASGGRQKPWYNASLEGDYCFGGCQTKPIPTTVAVAKPTATTPLSSPSVVTLSPVNTAQPDPELEKLQSELAQQTLKEQLQQQRLAEQKAALEAELQREREEAARLQAELEQQKQQAVQPPSVQVASVAPTTPVSTSSNSRTLRDRMRSGGLGPEIILIRGGSFMMGSPSSEQGRYDDERQHRVSVNDVYIGKYEVTFAEYDRFVQATDRDKPNDQGWGRGNRSVINVSWHDAVAYTEWLSWETGARYRLPTEAEWEYAVRAGTQTPFHTGQTISTVQANYDGNYTYGNGRKGVYRRKTLPVGQFVANAWGLHDVHGNIREWTCSVYAWDYDGSELKCSSNNRADSRVLRGGSWYFYPRGVRSANRGNRSLGNANSLLGFRLARSP